MQQHIKSLSHTQGDFYRERSIIKWFAYIMQNFYDHTQWTKWAKCLLFYANDVFNMIDKSRVGDSSQCCWLQCCGYIVPVTCVHLHFCKLGIQLTTIIEIHFPSLSSINVKENVKIWHCSKLILSGRTTGVLSGLDAHKDSMIFMSLKNSHPEKDILQILCSIRWGSHIRDGPCRLACGVRGKDH